MSGNVEEWCQDGNSFNYNGAPNDGSAWAGNAWAPGSRMRGGSWSSLPLGESMFNTFCNVTSRSGVLRIYGFNIYGFRCARDL